MPELSQAYIDAVPELDDSYANGNAPSVNGEQMSMGCMVRSYHALPSGCMAAAPSFPDSLLLDEKECKERIAENIAKKRTLLDIRELYYSVLKSLNQDGKSLCWAFSSTKAVMYTRVLEGQMGEVLSAWYVAGMIKGWRDQGGWGVASLAFIAEHGIPLMSKCPSYDRSYATADVAADASLRKVTEWYDGGDDPERNKQILNTCNALNIPAVIDLNWMGHSMCCPFTDATLETCLPDNSWGENSGERGLYRITGRKTYPDSIVVPCVGAFAR